MQKWRNILLCAAVSFMFLFMAVGYAQLTDNMTINGSVTVTEIETVYITGIKVTSSANVTVNDSKGITLTKTGYLTFSHNDYVLKSQSGSNSGGSITITITVKNNSGSDQYFLKHTSTDESKLNNNVVITYAQSGDNRWVKHGQSKDFTITIQNTSKNSSFSLKDFESLLVFSPNFDSSVTEGATNTLAKMFANVLAGKGPNGDGKGITYKGKTVAANKIMEEITKKMTDVETGGYTGNVGNATQDEKDLMTAIFGDNITLQIGPNYYSVYILIKNQQIDGKGDNDMVIYVTADQLEVGGGEWKNNKWQNTRIVPVYALVFIKDGNSYKYCDHLFAGEAPVCDFGGALGNGKVGNFHTNIWNSTEFPNITDTSNGTIGQQYITTDGELDEAYKEFIKNNPNSLIKPEDLK